jgi:hypothetical protein
MEVHELKEFMDDRFTEFEKRMLLRCDAEHECLKNLKQEVRTHDRWLWLFRGVIIAITGALSYFGFKIRF